MRQVSESEQYESDKIGNCVLKVGDDAFTPPVSGRLQQIVGIHDQIGQIHREKSMQKIVSFL
jgi:hypothetical protein